MANRQNPAVTAMKRPPTPPPEPPAAKPSERAREPHTEPKPQPYGSWILPTAPPRV